MRRLGWLAAVVGGILSGPVLVRAQTPDHTGQVIEPVPLGVLVRDADPIVVLQVDKVLVAPSIVIFKPVANLKGRAAPGSVRHHVHDPAILEWARPGRTAVCFYYGGKAVTCLDNLWYYNWTGGEHTEPPVWTCRPWVDGFLNSYVGPADKLREYVVAMLAGKEVEVAAQVPGDSDSYLRTPRPIYRDWLHGKKGKVWQIKASLKITQAVRSDESPFFVRWGVDGLRPLPSLAKALEDRDARIRAEALQDLGQLGPGARAAEPAVRRRLNDPDGFVRVYAAETLARIDPHYEVNLAVLLQGLKDDKPGVRRAAADVLGGFGGRAQSAIPAQAAALRHDKDPGVRMAVAQTLGAMAPGVTAASCSSSEAVAALARALAEDRNECVRLLAAKSLLRFGAEAWGALPALRAALRDEKEDIAVVAADVLARFDPPAVQVLTEALADSQCPRAARLAIIENLGDLGPQAWPATSALMDALKSEDGQERDLAAEALPRINRKPPMREPRTPRRVGGLEGSAVSRRNAATALLWFSQQSVVHARLSANRWLSREDEFSHWSSFEQAWEDERANVWARTLKALELLKDERDVVPPVKHALRDRNVYARLIAALTLCQMGEPRSEAMRALVQVLEERPGLFWYAAGSLGLLGPEAKQAVPWLLEALRHENRCVFVRAAHITRQIDPRAVEKLWGPARLGAVEAARAGKRSPEQWQALWTDLASMQAPRGDRAVWEMTLAGDLGVRFLKERLRMAPTLTAQQIDQRIRDLNSDDYEVRRQATAELEAAVELAAPSLRQAVADTSSLEVRRRAHRLLEALDATTSPDRLRTLRAIAVLEHVGTPEARAFLAVLGRGASKARLTEAARASLYRLQQLDR
jgi:HEAT repeat protein